MPLDSRACRPCLRQVALARGSATTATRDRESATASFSAAVLYGGVTMPVLLGCRSISCTTGIAMAAEAGWQEAGASCGGGSCDAGRRRRDKIQVSWLQRLG